MSSTRPARSYLVAAFSPRLGAKNTLKVNPGVALCTDSFSSCLLLPRQFPPQPSCLSYPGGEAVLISPLYKGRANTAPFIFSLRRVIPLSGLCLMAGGS